MRKFTLLLLWAALLCAPQLYGDPATRPADVSSTPSITALESQTIAIAPKCVASTVGLVSTVQLRNGSVLASGSGVIISADGLILTAGHVIEVPGNKLTIRFTDGRVVQGVAVGLDHATDTGLARITDPAPVGGWAFCSMAPDASAALGDWVLATGNPGSIVVDRDPPLRLGRVSVRTAKMLCTNCALEPGDSGGPLFDLSGRVVGINSQIVTSGDIPEYISVHVPISDFSRQMKDLLAGMNANPDVNLDSRYASPKPVPGLGAGARAALLQLAAAKDPQAMQILADEKKNKALNVPPDLMLKLLKMAAQRDRTAAANSSTTAPAASPQTGIPAALRAKIGPQLKDKLLKQFPDAIISDGLLARLMDEAEFDPATGQFSGSPDDQDLRDMGVTAENGPREANGQIIAGRRWVQAGKTSLQTLSLFAPTMTSAEDCVVEIGDGRAAALLGTVVGSDGWIVTKASDLPANPMVVLPDGHIFRAKVVGRDTATDLALLKVNTTGLVAVNFTDAAPLGEWLAAPVSNPNQLAIGVVSLPARPIGETFAHFEGEQKLVLGVAFQRATTTIADITHGMPAEAAGLKPGDEVFELNGKPIATYDDFLVELKKAKSGDTLNIKVHRAGKDLEFKAVIGKAIETPQTASSIGEADNVAGGKLSTRRTNFPLAIQTDAAVWADQCGGPLLNLHGQAVGIVIARYDRCCTFALPAKLVQSTVAKLQQAK